MTYFISQINPSWNYLFIYLFFSTTFFIFKSITNRIIIKSILFLHTVMSHKDFLKSSKQEFDNPEHNFVKFLSPKRWKIFMIHALQSMASQQPIHINLITDLITIVSKVPEANFVQAGLEIRPFKPEFVEEHLLKQTVSYSTMASTLLNYARFKGQSKKDAESIKKKQRITEKTLKNQLNKQYHPYRFIIKNFCRLLELKYKQLIDVKKLKVTQIQSKLRSDLNTFTSFMHSSSRPYKKLFKLQKFDEEQKIFRKMSKFIEDYIMEHSQINASCHKILVYACRSQYSEYISEKMQDFSTPDSFDIPDVFKIDGSYIRSINSLMQFSQKHNHQESLNKLLQFRSNILKDIDEYYQNKEGKSKQLQLNAESQIQIIRFILGKLKGWACQIYGKLKFLQLIYGDEQIAYKYQQASFIYTQLSLSFQILGIAS